MEITVNKSEPTTVFRAVVSLPQDIASQIEIRQQSYPAGHVDTFTRQPVQISLKVRQRSQPDGSIDLIVETQAPVQGKFPVPMPAEGWGGTALGGFVLMDRNDSVLEITPFQEQAIDPSSSSMTLAAYQQGTLRTLKRTSNLKNDIFHMAFGVAEEAGEVAGKFKRVFRSDGGEITKARREEIKKELGDTLWYITALAHLLGYSLDEVAGDNLWKLQDRQARGVLDGEGDSR